MMADRGTEMTEKLRWMLVDTRHGKPLGTYATLQAAQNAFEYLREEIEHPHSIVLVDMEGDEVYVDEHTKERPEKEANWIE